MDVIRTPREMQERADAARAAGRRIALVPTMGALHAGHLSLVEEARKRADVVCVSIFVNPTQFGEGEDFDRYPRTLEGDASRCAEEGVDWVYAPSAQDVYPPGSQTWVEVDELTRVLCGASRPGHFRGVTTVVSKLFLAAKPHVAVFGQKDFQQVAVIRRMVRDLGFDVEIVGAPIVREPDGVALSSRNVNLSPEARLEARVLVQALDDAEKAIALGERRSRVLLDRVQQRMSATRLGSFDYFELRDPETLSPSPERLTGPALLALAARFRAGSHEGAETVRLIDNRVLTPPRVDEESQP